MTDPKNKYLNILLKKVSLCNIRLIMNLREAHVLIQSDSTDSWYSGLEIPQEFLEEFIFDRISLCVLQIFDHFVKIDFRPEC